MKKALSILLVLVMVLGLAACGGKGTTTDTTTAAGVTTAKGAETTKATEASKKSSRTDVNLYIYTALTTLDAHVSKDVADKQVYWQLCDFLMNQNENTGEIEPRIATRYEVSDDGLTYTYYLRDDVKFHNGDTVKASDCAFSINRCLDSSFSRISPYLKFVVKAEAKDDTTLVIHMENPSPALTTTICSVPMMSEKVIKEQGEAFGTKVHDAFCGPYRVVSADFDSKIVLEAFPDYYRGEASIKKITFSVITEQAAATVALESGDLDFASVPVADYLRLKDNNKFSVISQPTQYMFFLMINGGANKVLENKKVRQAICYAIDRKEMNIGSFEGLATEAIYLMDPKTNTAFPDDGDYYDYDPEKAKALLAEAGYPDGVDVGKLLVRTGDFKLTCAQIAQAQLARVGIKVEIETNDATAVANRGRSQDYDMYMNGTTWMGEASRVSGWVAPATAGKDTGNFHEGDDYDHDKMVEILLQADSNSDTEVRKAYYKEALNYVNDYAQWLPLLYTPATYAWNADLDAVPSPQYPVVYDWSWK